MIARYKGAQEDYGFIVFKPGSVHSIQFKHKFFSKFIWLEVDGLEEIPYTLFELFTIWEPVEE